MLTAQHHTNANVSVFVSLLRRSLFLLLFFAVRCITLHWCAACLTLSTTWYHVLPHKMLLKGMLLIRSFLCRSISRSALCSRFLLRAICIFPDFFFVCSWVCAIHFIPFIKSKTATANNNKMLVISTMYNVVSSRYNISGIVFNLFVSVYFFFSLP